MDVDGIVVVDVSTMNHVVEVVEVDGDVTGNANVVVVTAVVDVDTSVAPTVVGLGAAVSEPEEQDTAAMRMHPRSRPGVEPATLCRRIPER